MTKPNNYVNLLLENRGGLVMKNKLKKFLTSYFPGFILGIISVGIITVYATTYFPSNDVTYDNQDSKLQSTNVQDAIDELYGVCFPPKASDQIIEDGKLEQDPYECRYFFTGANPNNYITFNNEKAGWRIISVECDGTIKIMRNQSIENMAWDSSNSNNWVRPATLNTYLNKTYLTSQLSSEAQGQIASKDFSIGAVQWNDTSLSNSINNENSRKWNGKVALPTVTEYLRTNSSNDCKNLDTYISNYSTCQNNTWMLSSNISYWWTLSPFSDLSAYYGVYFISSDGKISDYGDVNDDPVQLNKEVRPALYLSSEVKIAGGTGTQSDPYTIE